MNQAFQLYDFAPDTGSVYQEVLSGLQKSPKEIDAKLTYDERGSQLFEQICRQPEYYLTRTELALMQAHGAEIADLLGKNVLLIEYGSGNSEKTRILLDHLQQAAGYVPIDISKEILLQSAAELVQRYPALAILPVCADYEVPFDLPHPVRPVSRYAVYYPGSTIGNREPQDAVAFLKRMRQLCGDNGALVIGVDLKKDPSQMKAAYNDRAGISATFNRNVLLRFNQELGADFQLDQFQHHVIYDAHKGCVVIYILSQQDQTVHLNGSAIHFHAGEKIWRAHAYKYTVEEFEQLATKAGWQVQQVWTDEQRLFSVQLLYTQLER